MDEKIIFERRYCGPPDSGNGGYTCGQLAAYIDGTAEVTLRQPRLFDRILKVEPREGSSVRLLDGNDVIAVANKIEFSLDGAEKLALEEAQIASRTFTAFHPHPFPACFVCGPNRLEADGLPLFLLAQLRGKMPLPRRGFLIPRWRMIWVT
jgi:hypothetical protein